MTEATTWTIPEFHRGDRMGKALNHAGIGMTDMADYLGVTRATVSRWVNGHTAPTKGMLRLWAMRTGVPLEWLETGQAPAGEPGPGLDVVRHQGLEPRTRWLTTRPAA